MTQLVGAIAQVAVFALVPLAWWLQAGRPEGSFPRWLGFRAAKGAGGTSVLAATVTCGLGFFASALFAGPSAWTMTGEPFAMVLAIALAALIQTALSEELFFRGFLLNWLGAKRTGPVVANLVQALACGLVRMAGHWVFVDRELTPCLAALALGAGSAFLAGWVKQDTGSLLLPWAAHGAGNLIAGLVAVVTR